MRTGIAPIGKRGNSRSARISFPRFLAEALMNRWLFQPKNRKPWAVLCLGSALLGSGCTHPRSYWANRMKVGPQYERPIEVISQKWIDDGHPKVDASQKQDVRWWEEFDDPVLSSLIESAYLENYQLKDAGFKVLAARANYNIKVGQLMPQAQSFSTEYDRLNISRNLAFATLLRRSMPVLVGYVAILLFTIRAFGAYPLGFVPIQDQGYLVLTVQMDDGCSVQRTNETLLRIDQEVRSIPGVKATLSIAGQSLLYNANSPNWGSMFVILDEFEKRRTPQTSGMAILLEIRKRLSTRYQEATLGIYPAPPVKGLGTAGGFKFYIEDRGNLGEQVLQDSANDMVTSMAKLGLPMVKTDYNANQPQFFMDIDRQKVRDQGVEINDVFTTLQTYMGSVFINNFNLFSRYWQVKAMAMPEFRAVTQGLLNLKVRNKKGEMVPMATLLHLRNDKGPPMVMRYNLYPAAPVAGIPSPTMSTGTLIQEVNQIASKQLPDNFQLEWSEIFYLQIISGNTAVYLFLLGILLVFLVLAALYESWSHPFAVILVVPLCLLSAMGGLYIAHLPIDILAQVGLVVLVGLASKNAILIVEFARELRHSGKTVIDATREACLLRLRPIAMTSFAFILGVFPLVVARGAGAEMRWSLGITVFAGMLGVTLFGTLLTPVFFLTMERLSSLLSGKGWAK